MITLEKYQEYNQIPSGTTGFEYKKEMVHLLNIDATKLTEKQLDEKLNNFAREITVSNKKHKKIKLKNKWYVVDRKLHKLSLEQWIYFDNIMANIDKDNISQDIDKILSVFVRPCRLYKFFPSVFDGKMFQDNLKVIGGLDVKIALEMVNFFFHFTMTSLQNMNREYLEGLEARAYKMKE